VAGLAGVEPILPPLSVVSTTTVSKYMMETSKVVPPQVFGRMQTATVSHASDDFITTYADLVAKLPQTGAAFMVHIFRPDSVSCGPLDAFPNSLIPSRKPHLMVELLANGTTQEDGKLGSEWAASALDTISRLAVCEPYTYPCLTSPEKSDLGKMYGEKAAELTALKKELDPACVFRNTVPRII